MAPSLEDLPMEVFAIVVSFVNSERSCCNLTFCSRRLHALSLPHLFEHVHLHKKPNSQSEFFEGFYIWKTLGSLTCLLLSNEDRANMVKHFTASGPVTLGRWDIGKTQLQIDPTTFSTGALDCTKELASPIRRTMLDTVSNFSLSTEEENAWIEDLRQKDHDDATLAVLLPKLRNLQQVSFDSGSARHLFQVFRHAALFRNPSGEQSVFP